MMEAQRGKKFSSFAVCVRSFTSLSLSLSPRRKDRQFQASKGQRYNDLNGRRSSLLSLAYTTFYMQYVFNALLHVSRLVQFFFESFAKTHVRRLVMVIFCFEYFTSVSQLFALKPLHRERSPSYYYLPISSFFIWPQRQNPILLLLFRWEAFSYVCRG